MGVVYDYVRIGAQEELAERPFTDFKFNYEDMWAMNLMAHRLRDLVNAPDGLPTESCPLTVELYEPDGRYLRIILCDTSRAVLQNDLFAVGFFGQRRQHSRRTAVLDVDERLVAELMNFPQVVAYMSLQLDGGDFGNLVLLNNDAAREQWRESKHHQQAVAEIAPAFYATVRLHNGLLRGGVLHEDAMVQLMSTKYFDYQDELWCGYRQVTT